MRGKKGSGHFEMIISFVFFVGFVFYLFLFLNPWSDSSLPDSAINQLYDSFSDNISTNLSSVFIKANISNPSATCFEIDLPDELFKYIITDRSSIVTKLGGVDIDSELSSGNLNFNKDDEFFRVAISPEFSDESVSSCVPLDDFELGGVVELEVASYSSLVAMNNSYHSNYDSLKNDLRLANIFDFAIVPEGMSELEMMPESEVPDSVQVLAKDYVVKVLKSNGEVSNERISIRIW